MRVTINACLLFILCASVFTSCKDDENKEDTLDVYFTEGTGYAHADTTLPGGASVLIGFNAETLNFTDAVTTYTVTESVNGGTATTVHEETDLDVNFFGRDYGATLDTVSGTTHAFTFQVTASNGWSEQIGLTITVQ